MTSKIVVNNIEADSGINTVTFGGDISGNLIGNVTGNVNATGVSTFSDTVNVGAGKSVRIFGSASGYSDLIAPAVAGSETFTLPGTGGTLDRLNRAGNILQVVQGSDNTVTSSTNTTFVDTGLSQSITPVAASSNILVLVYLGMCIKTAADAQLDLRLLRDATSIFTFAALNNNAATTQASNVTINVLDTPTYTLGNSITYKTQLRNRDSVGTVITNQNGTQTIILMEVAA